jgi:TPP-dependent pyruvate/acetoin dehydrogenase alpha subunit
MDKEEMAYWMDRDPITIYGQKLIEADVCTKQELEAIDAKVEAQIEEAVEYAQSCPDPKPEDALQDVFA